MSLGMKVGLGPGPGNIVLDGEPVPPKKGHSSPPFSDHVYRGQTVAHLSYIHNQQSKIQKMSS